MNPECMICGYGMLEVESNFLNDTGSYEVVGYECPMCKVQVDLLGKEVLANDQELSVR